MLFTAARIITWYSLINFLVAANPDTLIVETAIDVVLSAKPAIIIAEDIDSLVIFVLRASIQKNIYFLKPSKAQKTEEVYDSDCFCIEPSSKSLFERLVGFIHIFCDCDTTSSFYDQGRKNFGNSL